MPTFLLFQLGACFSGGAGGRDVQLLRAAWVLA